MEHWIKNTATRNFSSIRNTNRVTNKYTALDKQEAFIAKIKDNEGIIHKVINLYVHAEEDKKDLYQEVLLQAWKSYDNFKRKAKFSTWLYKVALNTALTFKKRNKGKAELINEIPESSESEDNSEFNDILFKLIKKFNEVDRMLIVLHLDGYKNTEIAEITGMKRNHVNVKVHRLKLKIVEQYKKINDGTK